MNPAAAQKRNLTALLGVIAGFVASAGVAHAQAQDANPGAAAVLPSPLSASLTVQTTWTSNAGLTAPGSEIEDTITEVAPSLQINSVGKRVRLVGEVGASAVNYVNGSGRDQVQPRIHLRGNLEAVPQHFFLDGSVTTTQLTQDPYVGSAQSVTPGAGTANTMTATTYALSPYLNWRMSERVRVRARDDETRTHTTGATSSLGTVRDGRFSRGEASFEVLPKPLGLTLSGQRTESRFDGVAQDALVEKIARAIVLWAPAPEWEFNARGGHEQTRANGRELADDKIYGGGMQWRPTERTVLKGVGEHRFFGTGWEGAFTHRMPWLAIDVRATRELTSFPQELLTLTSGGNVALLLDAMLTTRFPDPVERARQVQELIRNQGLPTTLGAPLTLYTQDAFISTARSLTLGYIGAANTLTWSAGTQRVENVLGNASALSAGGTGNSDQFATALNFTHQIGRNQTLGATLGRTLIRSLEAGLPDNTQQRALRLVFMQRLSPRTQFTVGARRRLSDSRFAADFTENAVFAAITSRS